MQCFQYTELDAWNIKNWDQVCSRILTLLKLSEKWRVKVFFSTLCLYTSLHLFISNNYHLWLSLSHLPHINNQPWQMAAPPWYWFCWKFVPVKPEFFLSAVAKCLHNYTVLSFLYTVHEVTVVIWCYVNKAELNQRWSFKHLITCTLTLELELHFAFNHILHSCSNAEQSFIVTLQQWISGLLQAFCS